MIDFKSRENCFCHCLQSLKNQERGQDITRLHYLHSSEIQTKIRIRPAPQRAAFRDNLIKQIVASIHRMKTWLTTSVLPFPLLRRFMTRAVTVRYFGRQTDTWVKSRKTSISLKNMRTQPLNSSMRCASQKLHNHKGLINSVLSLRKNASIRKPCS